MTSKISKLFLVLVFLLTSGCAAKVKLDPPIAAKNTNIQLLNGQYVNLNDQPGRYKVLAFWATDSSKSRYQILKLEQLAKQHRYDSNWRFYAINLNTEANIEKVKDFIDKKDLTHIRHASSGNAGEDESFLRYKDSDKLPQFVVVKDNMIVARSRKVLPIKEFLK